MISFTYDMFLSNSFCRLHAHSWLYLHVGIY